MTPEIATRERLSELTVLSRLAERAGEAVTEGALLDGALDDLLSLLEEDFALACVVDEGEKVLRLASHQGLPADVAAALARRPFPLGQGVLGEAAKSGRLVVLDDGDCRARVVAPGLRSLRVQSFAAVPLRARGRVLGVIGLGSGASRPISGERLTFLEVVGNQLGALLAAVRAQERAQAAAGELQGLTAIATQLTRLQDPDKLLSLIAREAGRLLNAEAVGIRTVEGNELVVAAGNEGGRKLKVRPRIKIGESLSGRIALERRPIAVHDLEGDDRPLPDHAMAALTAGFRSFLGVPFISQDKVVGTLSIYTRQARHFSEEEVKLLSVFADQAAIAIENAHLYRAQQVRAARLQSLAKLNQLISSSLDTDAVLRAIGNAAGELMKARLVAFWIVDEPSRTLALSSLSDDWTGTEYPLKTLSFGEGGVGWVAEHRQPLNLPDLTAVGYTVAHEWWRANGLRSMLAVPILLDGALVAVLALCGTDPFVLDGDAQDVLASFAAQAAVAIRNAGVFAESERRRRAAEEIAEIGQILSGSLAPEVVANRIVDGVCRVLQVELPTLYRLDPVSGELRTVPVAGGAVGGHLRGVAFPSGVGVVGRALADRAPFASADVLADPRLEVTPEFRRHVEKHGRRAALAVPLITRGEVVGVLLIRDRAGRVFSEEEIGLAQAFAGQAALALENASLYQESEDQRKSLATLVEVSQRLTRGLDLPAVLGSIANAAAQLFQGEAGFRLIEGDELVRVGVTPGALQAMARERLRVGESISGRVAATGEALVVSDTMGDDRVAPDQREALRAATDRVGALMCIPIRLASQMLGTLNVYRERGHRFGNNDLELAATFAEQAAIAIENARLYRRAEDRAERLAALSAVTRLMISAGDSREVYAAVARAATTLLGARLTRLWMCDPEAGVLRLGETYSTDPAYALPGPAMTTFPMNQGVLGAVMETRQPQYIPEILDDARFINRALAQAGGFHSMAAIPLVIGDRGLGALMTFFGERREFTDEDKDLMHLLADQAAIAIDKSQLYERLTVKNTHLQELFEIARQATVSLTLSDLLPALVKAAAGFVGHDAASIRLLDASGTTLAAVADHGLSERFAARGDVQVHEGVAGIVVASGRPVIVEDVATDPRYLHGEGALAEGIRSLAIVPLRSRDRNIGTLCTYSRTPRRYSEPEVELLARFANVAAVAIENAKLYEDAQTRAARMKRLSELSQLVNSSLDLQQVLDFVTDAARDLVKADLARLWVLDEKSGVIRLAARTGTAEPADAEMAVEIGRGQGIAGWVIEHRRTYYSADVVEDPLWIEKDWARQAGFVSAIITPLIVGDHAIGNLTIMTKSARQFGPDEQEVLELFAAMAASAIHNSRLYAEARAQAKALQDKNAELDSFVYVVSHDLKSPLVAIQGMASMLLEDEAERLDGRGRRYLERIGANVDQMERLIADLLALSRVGREARPAAPVAVDEVVDEVLLELGERILARGVKVTRGELGTTVAVRTQLLQVWSNLISNAVKYLGEAPHPTVELASADRGDTVEYWVRDNGIGIDPAYHAQVFELFQRLKDVEAEGTGVGLPIVKKIVEAAGGRVWVESARGQGATFHFTWPKSARGA